MSRDDRINKYLNVAKIESEITLSKNNNYPLSLSKFKYEVDLDNAFFFKDVFKEIYRYLNFPLLLYNANDSFLLFFRNKKLHESIVLFKRMQKTILNKYNIKIDNVGISELHEKDSSQELLDRVNRYFVISKRIPENRLIYGTREFDFYNSEKREDNLKTILSQDSNIKIYTIYKGIPIKENAVVIKYEKQVICFQAFRKELMLLWKNESFIYVKHPNFPNVIKGEIAKIDYKRLLICIKDLEFQDNSIVDREHIRIAPPKSIRIMIEYQNSLIADGEIKSISVDSILVLIKKGNIKQLKNLKDKEFVLKFRLFVKDSIAVDNISIKSTILNIVNNEIIFLIKPNNFIKVKISNYVIVCKEEILKNLKIQNKM